MALLARLWRVLLVCAFLLAQNAALAHPIWDLGAGSASQAGLSSSDAEDGKAKSQGGLCDFHSALGTVLGALGASVLAIEFVEPPHIEIAAAGLPAPSLPGLAPASRGPPLHP